MVAAAVRRSVGGRDEDARSAALFVDGWEGREPRTAQGVLDFGDRGLRVVGQFPAQGL